MRQATPRPEPTDYVEWKKYTDTVADQRVNMTLEYPVSAVVMCKRKGVAYYNSLWHSGRWAQEIPA